MSTEKVVGTPRDVSTCQKEFEIWLQKQTKAAGMGGAYIKAMKTAWHEYNRAKQGLTGVRCSCDNDAVHLRKMRMGHQVGLCIACTNRFDDAVNHLKTLEDSVLTLVNKRKTA